VPKYLIEREIPGAGDLSQQELQAISQKSCGVLREMGPQIQWVESYVTGDKIYCVYIAPDEDAVREGVERYRRSGATSPCVGPMCAVPRASQALCDSSTSAASSSGASGRSSSLRARAARA